VSVTLTSGSCVPTGATPIVGRGAVVLFVVLVGTLSTGLSVVLKGTLTSPLPSKGTISIPPSSGKSGTPSFFPELIMPSSVLGLYCIIFLLSFLGFNFLRSFSKNGIPNMYFSSAPCLAPGKEIKCNCQYINANFSSFEAGFWYKFHI
jgi:hypothetical protein